ncbi:CapA family protein [Salinibacterium sp. ZJ454]|uniref:CapA family protein n=1 Tax=Salinibacterium sp. ZJ454 TaxID=2708339 RepID=UPI001423D5D7|nr:CapA family protein [Salinibacterium sp. ZJ454]
MRRALRRDRWLIAISLTALIGIVFTVVTDYRTRTAPAVETVKVAVHSPLPKEWTLQFAGDTMVSDGAQPLLDQYGYDAPFSQVAPLLRGDVVIANAEAPISEQTVPANPGKSYSYNSTPLVAGALQRAGVDVLGLGNNHAMDMRVSGLRDTQEFAQQVGIDTFGAGGTIAEAEKPLLLTSPIGTVGIVALGEDFGDANSASEDQPGTVVLSPEAVQRGIDLARAGGADWVIAYVHWGDNYTDTLPPQRYWAQMMVDAGYDLIVGTGPHIAAPIEFVDGVPVVYSLGNFVFGAPGRFKSFGKEGIGLLLSVTLSTTAPTQLAVRCILTNNKKTGYVPQACGPEDTARIMPSISPRLRVDGTTARMSCVCLPPVKRE